MFHLMLLVVLCFVGYLAVVAAISFTMIRWVSPQVQARRFATSAIRTAEADFQWSEFNRRLGP